MSVRLSALPAIVFALIAVLVIAAAVREAVRPSAAPPDEEDADAGRIEPGEIEARLLRHAGVAAAAVVARPDASGPEALSLTPLANPELSLTYEILQELRRARAKFPGPNVTTLALVEEVGELAKAAFEEPRARVRAEAVQVACMAMRVVLDGDATLDSWRESRGLDALSPRPLARTLSTPPSMDSAAPRRPGSHPGGGL